MIKRDTLKTIDLLIRQLEGIENRMAQAKSESSLGITFGGRYQNDDFVNKVRPAIVAAVQDEMDEVNAKLIALGVNPEKGD